MSWLLGAALFGMGWSSGSLFTLWRASRVIKALLDHQRSIK